MSFAKIFETEKGQILVMRDTNDDNEAPELKIFVKPKGMGVCCNVMSAPKSLAGIIHRDQDFESMDAERAVLLAAPLFAGAEFISLPKAGSRIDKSERVLPPSEQAPAKPQEQVLSGRDKAQTDNVVHEIHLLFAASCANSLERFGVTLAQTADNDERKQKAEAISTCFASAASYMAQQYCQALYGSSAIADVPAPQGFVPIENNTPEAGVQAQQGCQCPK